MTTPLYDALSGFWATRASPMPIPRAYRHMHSPTMTIRNRLYSSDTFRKIHVEHACTPGGLDILHHVAFPRPDRDAPILGMDLVCMKGRPTMGICDLSGGGLEHLIAEKHPGGLRREIPEWGRSLFSKQCVLIDRPDIDEFAQFLESTAHVYADAVDVMPIAPVHRQKYRENFKILYRDAQCQNPRTYAVLAAAFGPDLAERYMREVMFG